MGVFPLRNFFENEPSHKGVVGLTSNEITAREWAPYMPLTGQITGSLVTSASFTGTLGTGSKPCVSH